MERRRSFRPTVNGGGNGGPAYFKGWKLWDDGDYVIGKYESSYESNFRGQVTTNYRLKVLECNFSAEDKEGNEIDNQELVGQTLILNGVGKLDKFMEKVTPGMLVEVEYGGKKPGNDGQLYHQFNVLQAGEEEAEDDL